MHRQTPSTKQQATVPHLSLLPGVAQPQYVIVYGYRKTGDSGKQVTVCTVTYEKELFQNSLVERAEDLFHACTRSTVEEFKSMVGIIETIQQSCAHCWSVVSAA